MGIQIPTDAGQQQHNEVAAGDGGRLRGRHADPQLESLRDHMTERSFLNGICWHGGARPEQARVPPPLTPSLSPFCKSWLILPHNAI